MRLIWTKELYGTGDATVDSQHQELFNRINQVMESIEKGGSKADVGNIMNFLGSYAVSHFACEEKIMDQKKCATACQNKEAHKIFLSKYADLKKMFDESGVSDAFVKGLQNILFPWLRSHIMTIDSKLKEVSPQQ